MEATFGRPDTESANKEETDNSEMQRQEGRTPKWVRDTYLLYAMRCGPATKNVKRV
jgi:hypothetical protein